MSRNVVAKCRKMSKMMMMTEKVTASSLVDGPVVWLLMSRPNRGLFKTVSVESRFRAVPDRLCRFRLRYFVGLSPF